MPRPQSRIAPLIQLLEAAWNLAPDYRLGQLISNLLGPGPHDVFFTEDSEWKTLLENFIEVHNRN